MLKKISRRRWGDNDHGFGPFTFAVDKGWKPLAIILKSGCDEYPGCSLRVSGFGGTMIVALPQIIQPYRKKVVAKSWDEATVHRLGRNWYYDVHPREFGVSYSEGHLSILYGRQTHDSSTEQRWGCRLPWTRWRHVRHSLYGLDGTLFAHLPVNWRHGTPGYDEWYRLSDACPTVAFEFDDFDGERIVATTKIEEREWRFGTGWFRWLSWFRKPKVRRSLDLRFSKETGRRKGSWKGGTIGHGIDMLPGELHEAAFRRYCEAHEMKFIALCDGASSRPTVTSDAVPGMNKSPQ